MVRTRESFGENIDGLVFNGNIWKSNLLTSHNITNGMTIYFNIFGTRMKNKIGNNLNSFGIIEGEYE
jgi:hypothetical protein